MEFTRRLNALLMKLFGGERVLPVLLLSNLGSSLVEFGESTRDCSPGHAGKEGPHLAMSGESRGFSGAAVPVWGFSQGTTGSSGSLSCDVREVKSPYEWRGPMEVCNTTALIGIHSNERRKESQYILRESLRAKI